MRFSRRLVAGALLCLSGCGNEDDGTESVGHSDATAPSIPAEASTLPVPEAGSVITVPEAGSTVTQDAGSSTGLPRQDAGSSFPFDAGSFPRLDAGGARADSGTTPASDAGTVTTGDGGDRFANARQVCVDTINMYRATLNLPPLKRAAPAVETCSDNGAKKDGDSGKAHGSANSCPGMSSQNTCPGWPVGGFGGGATLEAALQKCLAQMWAEGEPPEGTQECLNKYFKGDTACFLAHGHYINMKNAMYSAVSCGFYEMSANKFWMNQDFGR